MKESVQVSSFMIISIIITSTRMKLAKYICAYLTAVHADDKQHQHNLEGWDILDLNVHPTSDEHQAIGGAIPNLNVHPTDDEHQADGDAIPDLNVQLTGIEQQADGDVTFAVPDEQDGFNFNLQASAQYEEMQESMITKLCCSSMLFIIMHNYFDSMRLHRGHT
jgi:hypothetical protein